MRNFDETSITEAVLEQVSKAKSPQVRQMDGPVGMILEQRTRATPRFSPGPEGRSNGGVRAIALARATDARSTLRRSTDLLVDLPPEVNASQ